MLCILFSTIVVRSQNQSPDNIGLCSYERETDFPISITYNGANIIDLSGVTYSAETNKLYMVSNTTGANYLYQTDLEGNVERRITLAGFEDTEGIVHIGGTRFAVSDEETRRIIFFDINSNTTIIRPTDEYIQLPNSLGPWGNNSNKSLEGVSYNPTTNTIYTVKEGGEDTDESQIRKGFYSFPLPNTLPKSLEISEVNQLCFATIDSSLLDLAGMHHVGRTFNGATSSLIISHLSKKIINIDKNCTKIGEFSLDFMNQPEGLTMDNSGNIYIVGEPNEFAVISPNPSLDPNGNGLCNDEVNLKGDVNLDGVLNILDAYIVAEYTVGLRVAGNCISPVPATKICLENADMYNTGVVTISDAYQISRCAVGYLDAQCSN